MRADSRHAIVSGLHEGYAQPGGMVAPMLSMLMSVALSAPPAEDVQLARLEWQAVEGCPGAQRFIGALSFRTARARIVDDTSDALIVVGIERVGRRFRGRLTLRLPTGVTNREAQGPRCESVVEALSLMSALVIDPEHARLGPLPAQLPLEPVKPPPREVEPPVVPVVQPEPAKPEPVVEPVAVVQPAVVEPAPAPAQTFRLGAFLQATTAISGQPDFGGAAALSFQRNVFRARLELGGGTGRTVTTSTGAGRYDFHVQANTGAGLGVELGPFAAELLAVAQLTLFTVQAPEAIQPISATRFSPAIGPSAGLSLSFGPWSVVARALVGFTLRRDTYVIDPEGGVFSNPLVFFQPSLGVQLRL